MLHHPQIHINDRFASFSESLYVADRHARDEVRQRAQLQQRIAEKQKEEKEEHLRSLAQRARDERSGIAAPSTSAGASRVSGAPGQAAVGYDTDDEEDDGRGGAVASRRGATPTGSAANAGGATDEEESDGETPEDRKAAQERAAMRRERAQERERELRMSNMGTEQRARVLARAQNRDISEKVALGLAKPTMSKESMVDSRLFNQEQLSHGFGDDESYNLYDRPLFSGASAAAAIYKRTSGNGDDDDDAGLAGTAEGIEGSMKNDRFNLGQGKFSGSELQSVRDGPVQFEKDVPTTATIADPFGVNAFLDEAKRAAPKKHGLDTRGEEGRASKRQRD